MKEKHDNKMQNEWENNNSNSEWSTQELKHEDEKEKRNENENEMETWEEISSVSSLNWSDSETEMKKDTKIKPTKKKDSGYDSEWSAQEYEMQCQGMSSPQLEKERTRMLQLKELREATNTNANTNVNLNDNGGGDDTIDREKMHEMSIADMIGKVKLIGENEDINGSRNGILPSFQGEEDPSKVYCLCRKPYDASKSMICCDYCEEWYHLVCVGMSEAELSAMQDDKYKCPACLELESGRPLTHTKALQTLEEANLVLKEKIRNIKRKSSTKYQLLQQKMTTAKQQIVKKTEKVNKVLKKLAVAKRKAQMKFEKTLQATVNQKEIEIASLKKDQSKLQTLHDTLRKEETKWNKKRDQMKQELTDYKKQVEKFQTEIEHKNTRDWKIYRSKKKDTKN